MRNVQAAEWILSLVMPSERAEATVGDFLEASQSALALWRSVSRTFIAIIGQPLSNRPLHTAGIFARIYGQYFTLTFTFGIALVCSILVWAIIHALIGNTILDWLPMIMEGTLCIFVVPIRLGRSIQRQYPAEGVVLALLFSCVLFFLEIPLWIWGGTFTAPSGIEMSYSALVFPPPALAVLLAAAIVERRKSLRIVVQ